MNRGGSTVTLGKKYVINGREQTITERIRIVEQRDKCESPNHSLKSSNHNALRSRGHKINLIFVFFNQTTILSILSYYSSFLLHSTPHTHVSKHSFFFLLAIHSFPCFFTNTRREQQLRTNKQNKEGTTPRMLGSKETASAS